MSTESTKAAFERAVADVMNRRTEVKEQFLRAWLATLPPERLDPDWIIRNVVLVEQISADYRTTTWRIELRPVDCTCEGGPYEPGGHHYRECPLY